MNNTITPRLSLGQLGHLVPVAEDGEEIHEEVDDVQVEVEGGEDVLLGAEGVLVAPAHHQLGVVHDVQAANGKYYLD